MKRIIFVLLLLLAWSVPSYAVTSNADGSRTYSIPTDFVDINNVVWGHPVGITPGDTLSGLGNTFSDNMTINVSGLPGSAVTIRSIGANNFDLGVNEHVRLIYSVATEGVSCVNVGGDNNEIYNMTLLNCTNGVTHSVDTTIKNVIFSGTATDINTTGGTATTSNNLAHTTDALFVNLATSDYRLLSSSPAINAGVNVGLTTDYRGMTVPQGSAPDIGAYEFGPGDPGFLKGTYRGSMGTHWLW